jgi:prepilin-type N-terminal cleavage/methylation domain-containing protein
MRTRKLGFTLIELLVVIAIVGILFSLVMGLINGKQYKPGQFKCTHGCPVHCHDYRAPETR